MTTATSGSGVSTNTLMRKKLPSKKKGVKSYVSGFISLARVSTSSGTNCSTRALHSFAISPTGMRSQDPSNTSLSSSCLSLQWWTFPWDFLWNLSFVGHQGVSRLPNHLLADRAHLYNVQIVNDVYILVVISTSSSSWGTVSFSHTALMQCFTAEHSLAWGRCDNKIKGESSYRTWGRLAHQ